MPIKRKHGSRKNHIIFENVKRNNAVASLILPILKRPSKNIKHETEFSVEITSDELHDGFYYLNDNKQLDGNFVCCLDKFEMQFIDLSINNYYIIINYIDHSEDEIIFHLKRLLINFQSFLNLKIQLIYQH